MTPIEALKQHPKYKYIAMDRDNTWHLFTKKPILGDVSWKIDDFTRYYRLSTGIEYNGKWTDSLYTIEDDDQQIQLSCIKTKSNFIYSIIDTDINSISYNHKTKIISVHTIKGDITYNKESIEKMIIYTEDDNQKLIKMMENDLKQCNNTPTTKLILERWSQCSQYDSEKEMKIFEIENKKLEKLIANGWKIIGNANKEK